MRLLLLVLFITVSYGAEDTNVVPGIFRKVVSNGLHLPAINTFSPITIPSLLHYTLINPTPSSYTISLLFGQQIKISSAS